MREEGVAVSVPSSSRKPFKTTIAPNLSVVNGSAAVEFYKAAFGAVELYRLDVEGGQVAVAQLSVVGAEFWLAEESTNNPSSPSPARPSVRMLLTVEDPDAFFERAVAAGATEVYAVHEEYGWRSGVVVDPDGHWWEIAKPLMAWPPSSTI
jgi:PhnB protein